ncbi:MAG TPA: hypothetical protein VH250_10120 [Granulicella sp.]|jgi:hypothetical protein|nr:hypothetical protein [Granulicella sp.]
MKRFTKYLLPVLGLAAGAASAASAQLTPNPITAASTGLDRGYFEMYDVHFAAAHTVFQQLLAQHPDDALAAASDAAAYLFGEFDRLHIIDVELFADQSRFDSRSRLIPDPAVRKAFDDRCNQANRLADAALQRNPRDATAFYVKTLVSGMQSDYALMIDRRDLTALNLTKQASVYSHQALALNPTLYDAYLASGVENYMLSLKSAPLRWLLGVTGAATDREEGVRLLTLTANQGHYLAPFARMMLSVAALRDGNPQRARAILIALAQQYPDNTLYARQLARIH